MTSEFFGPCSLASTNIPQHFERGYKYKLRGVSLFLKGTSKLSNVAIQVLDLDSDNQPCHFCFVLGDVFFGHPIAVANVRRGV